MLNRIAAPLCILHVTSIVLFAPVAARAQDSRGTPPENNGCPELCSAALSKQFNDDEKKAFAICVLQKKCPPATQFDKAPVRQNPLIGPFPR
jgi:hypothetical protein